MDKFTKDPDAVLEYIVDWSDWLGEDTITTSTWVDPTGITVGDSSNTSTAATVWLSGGTVGVPASITNRIITTDGRTDDRTIYLTIRER